MLSLLTLSLCFSQTTKQRIHQSIHPFIQSHLYRLVTNQLINGQPIHPPTPLLNQSINHLEAESWNGETFDKQIASAGGPAVSSHYSYSVPVPETHTHTQLL